MISVKMGMIRSQQWTLDEIKVIIFLIRDKHYIALMNKKYELTEKNNNVVTATNQISN